MVRYHQHAQGELGQKSKKIILLESQLRTAEQDTHEKVAACHTALARLRAVLATRTAEMQLAQDQLIQTRSIILGSQDKQQNRLGGNGNDTEHLQKFSKILYDLVARVTQQTQEQTLETRAVEEERAVH